MRSRPVCLWLRLQLGLVAGVEQTSPKCIRLSGAKLIRSRQLRDGVAVTRMLIGARLWLLEFAKEPNEESSGFPTLEKCSWYLTLRFRTL